MEVLLLWRPSKTEIKNVNRAKRVLAENARRFFRIALKQKDKFEASYALSDYQHQAASDILSNGLIAEPPFAASRFGYSELRALLTYIHINENSSEISKLFSYASGDKVEPWWSANTLKIITHNAGVFPNDINIIEEYCQLVLKDIPEINVLGSWLGGERWVKPLMPNVKFIRFHDFYHFLHTNPWTLSLKDKKVLVIHPFSKSIQSQYKRRDNIFSGVHTLPTFELITYQSVQSIAGNIPTGFDTWFQALDHMKEDISKIDFDIAILGCGAYGMSLATFIKRNLNRKAIHLGGGTQILFGIRGSRWDNDPNFMQVFNDYWVRPLQEEKPEGHQTIDNNCYW